MEGIQRFLLQNLLVRAGVDPVSIGNLSPIMVVEVATTNDNSVLGPWKTGPDNIGVVIMVNVLGVGGVQKRIIGLGEGPLKENLGGNVAVLVVRLVPQFPGKLDFLFEKMFKMDLRSI